MAIPSSRCELKACASCEGKDYDLSWTTETAPQRVSFFETKTSTTGSAESSLYRLLTTFPREDNGDHCHLCTGDAARL